MNGMLLKITLLSLADWDWTGLTCSPFKRKDIALKSDVVWRTFWQRVRLLLRVLSQCPWNAFHQETCLNWFGFSVPQDLWSRARCNVNGMHSTKKPAWIGLAFGAPKTSERVGWGVFPISHTEILEIRINFVALALGRTTFHEPEKHKNLLGKTFFLSTSSTSDHSLHKHKAESRPEISHWACFILGPGLNHQNQGGQTFDFTFGRKLVAANRGSNTNIECLTSDAWRLSHEKVKSKWQSRAPLLSHDLVPCILIPSSKASLQFKLACGRVLKNVEKTAKPMWLNIWPHAYLKLGWNIWLGWVLCGHELLNDGNVTPESKLHFRKCS